jgi:3-hydroxyisobutyrate dehydrogenase
MGYAMAMNVRKNMGSERTLYINDVYRPSCDRFKNEFESHGPIEIVDSAKSVAEHALTIISIVPTGKNVGEVYLDGVKGIMAGRVSDDKLNARRIYLECSTIDVATAQKVGAALETCGMGTYVDSPVSGGVPAAERGDLSLLLGRAQAGSQDGPGSDIDNGIRIAAEYMGSPDKIFYCGKLGNGLAAKICNNYLSCTILLANCEAMATGMKLGLDKHLLHKIIQNSTGQNFMADHVCPVPGVNPSAPSSNNYRLGFKAQMLVKDVGLGVNAAQSVGITPSIGDAAMRVFEKVAVDEKCIVSRLAQMLSSVCSLLTPHHNLGQGCFCGIPIFRRPRELMQYSAIPVS